jgi:8-oxo-dGTP pyrophosphatase MutT (NUDIX family)
VLRIDQLDEQDDSFALQVSAKGVIVADDRVLLLKSPDGNWDLPGGKVEMGEDILAGFQREVLEETGLMVMPEKLVSVHTKNRKRGRDVLRLTFLCRADAALFDQVQLSAEHDDCAFVPLDKARKLKLQERHRRPIVAAARLLSA